MKKVLELYKPIGKTPLQTIEEYKIKHPELTGIKLAYAGRLDPMAEGLLLVLVGDECKKRKEYEKLPKTYEFEVLFGISTDTFDVMGKIVKISKIIPQEDLLHGSGEYQKSKINELIKKYQGKMLQEYPPYSSPRVNGKPLFWWARENTARPSQTGIMSQLKQNMSTLTYPKFYGQFTLTSACCSVFGRKPSLIR